MIYDSLLVNILYERFKDFPALLFGFWVSSGVRLNFATAARTGNNFIQKILFSESAWCMCLVANFNAQIYLVDTVGRRRPLWINHFTVVDYCRWEQYLPFILIIIKPTGDVALISLAFRRRHWFHSARSSADIDYYFLTAEFGWGSPVHDYL